jgi:hypothetical protein
MSTKMTKSLSGLSFEQHRIAKAARAALTTLHETVPSSTVHHAVEDARRALEELIEQCENIKTHDAKPRPWRLGDPIDYSDPDCSCSASGMGRSATCKLHGAHVGIKGD